MSSSALPYAVSGLPRLSRPALQHTIDRAETLSGIGLHSGRPVSMTLRPAAPGTGILFRRMDLPAGAARDLPARADRVVCSPLCTTLTNPAGSQISTIEHLMAAFAALAIDNVIVETDAPELPILDGSAAPFVAMIDRAGICTQAAPRKMLRVLKRVHVEKGPVSATLEPGPGGLSVSFHIDFPAEAIGRQSCHIALGEAGFRRHLAGARTFCMKDDVYAMQSAGLALGGSLDNAIVVDGATVLNREGLRYDEEFVRHKALDAIGDLYMHSLPISGRYTGVRASHAMNAALLKALLADPTAYAIETVAPGSGLAETFTASRDEAELVCA
ncbi:UDP-3-O-[3-hydroxymyristoyl] N-acetylglucosamine deacetylase [Phaeovibrio sulfidiphilus]|uniref:UDP-3-O-acyl-N-acetylglucosamine deacetylase n=2 Tax=Phaeovibrio sulfidiphilus TaxID=1220600 RepID=A0A8J7CVM1_9PROT|nr:UDP-3-O-[3-hydroxymyristoyl] N-acetylglucosamine deacetylase [Phaeovibrio sulfidiphilus]